MPLNNSFVWRHKTWLGAEALEKNRCAKQLITIHGKLDIRADRPLPIALRAEPFLLETYKNRNSSASGLQAKWGTLNRAIVLLSFSISQIKNDVVADQLVVMGMMFLVELQLSKIWLRFSCRCRPERSLWLLNVKWNGSQPHWLWGVRSVERVYWKSIILCAPWPFPPTYQPRDIFLCLIELATPNKDIIPHSVCSWAERFFLGETWQTSHWVAFPFVCFIILLGILKCRPLMFSKWNTNTELAGWFFPETEVNISFLGGAIRAKEPLIAFVNFGQVVCRCCCCNARTNSVRHSFGWFSEIGWDLIMIF